LEIELIADPKYWWYRHVRNWVAAPHEV